MIRNWILFHVASGQAFFSGVALFVLAVLLSPRAHAGWRRRLRNALAFFGVLLVVISATPLALWVYAVLAILSIVWLAIDRPPAANRPPPPGKNRNRHVIAARAATIAAWLAVAAAEFTWHRAPRLPPIDRPVLAVLGDS